MYNLILVVITLVRRFLGSVERQLERYLTRFQPNMFQKCHAARARRASGNGRVPLLSVLLLTFSGLRALFQVMSGQTGFAFITLNRFATGLLVRLAHRYTANITRRVVGNLVLAVGVNRGILDSLQRTGGYLGVSGLNAYHHGYQRAATWRLWVAFFRFRVFAGCWVSGIFNNWHGRRGHP